MKNSRTWLRLTTLFIALLMALTAFTALAEDEEIRLVSRNRGSASDPKNNDIIKAIEEATGLNLNWELWAANDYGTQCAVLVAGGEYPDAMEYWCTSYPVELEQMAEDGLIMPLDTLLEKYGPNIIANRSDELYLSKTF